mmetsp:Transcript_8626/g.14623  ORF Transcript_8626/g.14623 Transcript_8626/m.14623 type:complete len:397 (-) Transcript_8626:219-1409(-)
MDPDIPLAQATIIDNVSSAQNDGRPRLKKDRTSRLSLPQQECSSLSAPDMERLQEQGFPAGLSRAMNENKLAFPLRIWVVDNSGSMNKNDGHRIVETLSKDNVKLVDCTRWAEIQQTVDFHVDMAALLKAPTVFRLLNDPGRAVGRQQFSVAENGPHTIATDVQAARQTMRTASPGGVTPLSSHVHEIRDNILAMESDLRANGSKVAIVLATDGLPTDRRGNNNSFVKNDFVEALRSLEGLPVWIVVRLCTDDEEVVSFYNELDKQLELSLEVLDDFMEEAKEVYENNDWLSYSLPLHRCREMGYHNRLFDLLDERRLTPDEVRDLLCLLFGTEKFDGAPDPQGDWKGFLRVVQSVVADENEQWNPVRRKLTPWVDVKKLAKVHKNRNKSKNCAIM